MHFFKEASAPLIITVSGGFPTFAPMIPLHNHFVGVVF